MTLTFILRAALLLFVPISAAAHLQPRQHTLNGTSTPTGNTIPTDGMAPLPSCRWIVVGTRAVGYNNWYSSTAEQVVGTHKDIFPVCQKELTEYLSHRHNDLYSQAQRHRGSGRLDYNTQVPLELSNARPIHCHRPGWAFIPWHSHQPAHR